ncbi:MAG: Xaa-Pro peptidase family protein [Patescibacteria group bacterium]
MFDKRIKDLREELLDEKLDGVLVSSVSNISYLSGYSNFSKEEREAYIFIGKNFSYIITDGRYSEAIKKEVPHLTLFERGNGKSTEELFKKHKKEIKALGIEEDNLTVEEHKIIKKNFKNLKHFNLSRSIKTKDEIKKIEAACQLGDKAFHHVLGYIKHGITEKELAFEIEYFIKKHGGELSFPTIVAFGKNSSVPHHHTGNDVLGPESSSGRQGQFILVDMGVKVEDYCSDMTRTVFFGEPSDKQKKMYEVVLEAQKKAVRFIESCLKSGKQVKAAEVDKAAREYILSKGFPSIPHSLGHGVGLEIHENPHLSPKSKDILKMGMVFSIEPGIYIEGFGSPRFTGEAGGVRIEDLFVIEKKGLRQLTKSTKLFSV